MATKQRFWRAKLTDEMVDAMFERLIAKYNAASESELIIRLLIEADKNLSL